MYETTLGENPGLEEAFAAFVQAQENGKAEDARKLLRDHAGLAEEVAMYYALCARVPKPWDSSVNSQDGRTIGDFELVHELGRGAEGVVYKARQKTLKTVVAVKVMRHERFASRSDVERFRQDYLLLASLDHPNIVRILYAGESDTGPYFAMELMAESLKDKRANGWLPTPKQAAELILDLAEAMEKAHEKKIVHRDLKPANILLKADGTPKIVDFGLAKKLDAGDSMTQAGAIVGTASYMAPEQARGQRVDQACDIYGLGAVLYELLTGRPPFVGTTLLETLEQVRESEPLPVRQLNPNVPPDLDVICLACLDKEPERRYGSATELAADLKKFLNDEPIQRRAQTIPEQVWRIMLRQRFQDAAAWGWIAIVIGGATSLVHVIHAWVIATEQPPGTLAAISAVYAPLVLAFYWAILGRRRLESGDRQGAVILLTLLAGSILLPLYHPPPSENMDMNELTAYRLSFYPLTMLVHGIVYTMQVPMFWAGFYLYGLGYFILGAVMVFWPEASPILFAAYHCATQVPLGVFMLRLGRSPEFEKRST